MCEAMQDDRRDTRRDEPTVDLRLPVMRQPSTAIKPSTMSRWRATSLVVVHLLMIGHVVHWAVTGRTISPVEPSEAMDTLNNGHVNAGFIFLAVSLAVTLVLGRFVCGWGCHMVAYQDLCTWLLKKIGLKPKAFRSRILVLGPLVLAVYMFIWPTVYRWWMGIPRPTLTNHLLKERFWETFPGPVIAIVTVLVCGFVMVYFLGAKGFCTYACPYGGFYALAERLAPGRILVTDACKGCGHCTAVCSSNVRVHEEVARYGMVVDPGCMKCMDCVSVCPNDALHFGFAKPPLGAKPKSLPRPRPYDYRLWEEILMVVVGLGALWTFRGLYGQIPLLLAMALAAITAYLIMKALGLIRSPNVRLQSVQLKRGRRLTRAGLGFTAFMVVLLLFTGHSGAVQYDVWRGHALRQSLSMGDKVWLTDRDWWDDVPVGERSRIDAAIAHLERVGRRGLLYTPVALEDLVWLYLAKGRDDRAEDTVHRLIALLPDRPESHRGLAALHRKAGRMKEAEASYLEALSIDASFGRAREDLAALLHSLGRVDDAVAIYRQAVEMSPDDPHWPIQLSRMLLSVNRVDQAGAELDRLLERVPASAEAHALRGVVALRSGDTQKGLDHMRRVLALKPGSATGHYDLGMAFLSLKELGPAIEHLGLAVERDPQRAVAQYNLGVANYMAGNLEDSVERVRESIRLDPNDPVAYGFLAVVLEERGDLQGAREAAQRSERLRGGS